MEPLEITQELLERAFTEWERRYRQNPDSFMDDITRMGLTEATYGEQCAAYFIELMESPGILSQGDPPPCDVCGKPSTSFRRDQDPTPDFPSGPPAFVLGKLKAGCDEHPIVEPRS
jgi:hypothetical protein